MPNHCTLMEQQKVRGGFSGKQTFEMKKQAGSERQAHIMCVVGRRDTRGKEQKEPSTKENL